MPLQVGPRGASLCIGERRVGGLRVWKASRAGISIVLVQLLVALHHVAPVAASYSCSSDADCQYPGCDNRNGGGGTFFTAYCHNHGSGDGDICTFHSSPNVISPTTLFSFPPYTLNPSPPPLSSLGEYSDVAVCPLACWTGAGEQNQYVSSLSPMRLNFGTLSAQRAQRGAKMVTWLSAPWHVDLERWSSTSVRTRAPRGPTLS